MEKLLKDELCKWRRRPKEATQVLTLGTLYRLNFPAFMLVSKSGMPKVYFCHIFVIMQELHSFSCVQATELDHELRNALAERGRATTALHVLTTMQRHNVRISFCFSCEWCDGVMCGRTLCNDIDIKLFEAYFFVQSHFKLAYNCSFHDLGMQDKASPGQVLIFILQSFPFL